MLNDTEFDPAGLSLPVQPPLDVDMLSMEWENVGEESFINVCELQLKFDGAQLSKSTEYAALQYHAHFFNSFLI